MQYIPTPEFESLLGTKSKEEISQLFLDHLKTTHPIPDDIKVTLTFTDKKKKIKGETISAIVHSDRTQRTSDITIFGTKDTDTPEVLSSVGHEYKHILQSFAEGVKWVPGLHFDAKKEVEAEIFGQFKARKFCYGW